MKGNRMKVYAVHGFPLWDVENETYIAETPVEVAPSEWLDAQMAAGLVAEVPAEPSAGKAKPKKPKSEEAV